MEPQVVVDIMQNAFRTALYLALPPLLSALLVGVLVSVFQAVTSIQEQTLIFVPKMLAVMLALVLTFAWMQSMLTKFTLHIYSTFPDLVK